MSLPYSRIRVIVDYCVVLMCMNRGEDVHMHILVYGQILSCGVAVDKEARLVFLAFKVYQSWIICVCANNQC